MRRWCGCALLEGRAKRTGSAGRWGPRGRASGRGRARSKSGGGAGSSLLGLLQESGSKAATDGARPGTRGKLGERQVRGWGELES